MKSTSALAALLAAASLAACDSASRISEPEQTPVAPSAAPRRAALVDQTNEQNFPYTWEGVNPCNGDPLVLKGTSHVIMHSSFDATGGLHLNSHFISEGTGVGVSMKEYQGRADDRYANQVPLPSAVVQESHRMRVTGPQRTDDFFVHFVFHITFNGKGMPTAEFTKVETRCNG